MKNLIEKICSQSRLLILMIPLGIAAAVALNQLAALLPLERWMPEYAENIRPSMFRYSLIQGLLLYGVVTPVLEEVLFRWVLFGRLKVYVSAVAAAVVSSIIFGMYHGNVVQGVYAFIFGLLFCFVYWRTDLVLSSVIMHGAANAFIYSSAFIPAMGHLNEEPWRVISMSACFLLSGYMLYWLAKKVKGKSIEPVRPLFPRH
ncbi:hypothetical protein SAMN06296386_11824 [Lachnospiraceae bacterium]|nr:hypothetical protein SAMN06296386_11824 [Lachnospiraceae bacterium]